MDLQPSLLRLTFDPGGLNWTLLNFGNVLDGPFKFPLRNGTEVVPTPDSDFPLILAPRNSEFTIKFTTADSGAASRQASMNAVLESLAVVPISRVALLYIEVQGNTTWFLRIEQCRISEHEPWHQPTKDGKVWTMKSWTLVCAGATIVFYT